MKTSQRKQYSSQNSFSFNNQQSKINNRFL